MDAEGVAAGKNWARVESGWQGHLRPPLKWAGGKRWQIPTLKPFWQRNQNRRLVEPFCGGLAVTLGLTPKVARVNDINPHLINFYKWLKRGLVIQFDMKNEPKYYYGARDRFNELLVSGFAESCEAASLFYYLNRTGYNGLCRFNSKGTFNVPFGSYTRIAYTKDFQAFKPLFAKWTFSSVDFEEIELAEGDFVYADPPYDVQFTHYSRGGFGWQEQERAAEWLCKHTGPVVLSNQATPRIINLYASLNYQLMFLDGPRRISCNGDRRPAPEILAYRNVD